LAVDLATIIGMIGAIAIIITAMVLSGGVGMFVDIPSVLIVVVGSIFVVMAKFGLGQFLGAGKVAAKAFIFKTDDPAEMIDEIVGLADEARKGGLLALEGKELSSEFLQGGIQLLVDGHDPDVVKTLLSKDKDKTVERHEAGSNIFAALGDVAPAMGMIGTLVGLVAMLSNMDDPKSIGPAMAIALLTTLYGAMLANMVAIPISDKLGLRRAEEDMGKSLVIDALLAIQGGQNPRVIDAMLRSYLPASQRGKDDE
jgi:chemotaxis protein MotA